MDVRSTQAKFACAGFKNDAASVEVLELLSYLQGAIRGAVVDDDYFPVEFAGRARALACCTGRARQRRSREKREVLLLREGAIEEPGDYESMYQHGDRGS